MGTATLAQPTVEETIQRIAHEFASLSKQLKKIAVYVESNQDQIGIDGVRVFADQCGVHPSAVVRFAQHFGFAGYKEFQAMFRGNLSRQLMPARDYQERIRALVDAGPQQLSNVDVAKEFLAGSVAGMHALEHSLDAQAFQRAVDLLSASDCVVVAASRRSFPVAAYLDYALQHTDKRIITINTVSSHHLGQAHSLRKGDVMVAISFHPYAEETLALARTALERGVQLIAITDSGMSPLAQLAQVALVVQESTTYGFRSLSSSMGLAQSLFIAMAYKLELPAAQRTAPALCAVG